MLFYSNPGEHIVVESKNNRFYKINTTFNGFQYSSWDEPLPPLYDWQTKSLITDLSEQFYFETKLESICDDFFVNNPQITNIQYMFRGTTRLVYIPEHLFSPLVHVENMTRCFSDSTDSLINKNLYIDTDASSLNVDYFYAPNSGAEGKINIYCKTGSVAYNAFLNNTTITKDRVNLIWY